MLLFQIPLCDHMEEVLTKLSIQAYDNLIYQVEINQRKYYVCNKRQLFIVGCIFDILETIILSIKTVIFKF